MQLRHRVLRIAIRDPDTEQRCEDAGVKYLEVSKIGVRCYVCWEMIKIKNLGHDQPVHCHNSLEILCAAGR